MSAASVNRAGLEVYITRCPECGADVELLDYALVSLESHEPHDCAPFIEGALWGYPQRIVTQPPILPAWAWLALLIVGGLLGLLTAEWGLLPR